MPRSSGVVALACCRGSVGRRLSPVVCSAFPVGRRPITVVPRPQSDLVPARILIVYEIAQLGCRISVFRYEVSATGVVVAVARDPMPHRGGLLPAPRRLVAARCSDVARVGPAVVASLVGAASEVLVGGVLILIGGVPVAVARRLIAIGRGLIAVTARLVVVRGRLVALACLLIGAVVRRERVHARDPDALDRAERPMTTRPFDAARARRAPSDRIGIATIRTDDAATATTTRNQTTTTPSPSHRQHPGGTRGGAPHGPVKRMPAS